MKQEQFQTPIAGGVATRLPQNPQDANRAENLVVDPDTGGWSTRVGYEPFKPGAVNYDPFANVGPVYSIHAAQGLANGARQHILFEADGNLSLVYDAAGVTVTRTLASNRNVPSPTEVGSWYTDTAYGTVVTNGVDRPVLIKPWPLGNSSESLSTITQCIRPFGFDAPAEPPNPHINTPFPPPPVVSPNKVGGGATTLWCPADSSAIADGGRWGLGFAKNGTSDPTNEALFGWSMSYISDTGSEGPRSVLATTSWELPAGAEGFRHAIALDIPTGPEGTVARKLYRTTNFSDDYVSQGDTTLYFVGLCRNNVEDLWYDAVRTADLGQPAPVVATGPLPAPRARFSALYNGCLFLDGGIDDARTLYYSAPGLIEQYAADAFLELSSQGGGITALFGNYTTLLVFREQGIDVVQGDYTAGFTVTTLSNSVVCLSPNSIQAIPGLGVVFLAKDGVYAITGGLQGGAVNDLVNLTVGLDGLIERITPDCLAKAVSAYSSQHREYHLYVPVDGNDRPNLGLILHVDRLSLTTELSPWSTRVGFPVGAITPLHNGSLVFGHHTGAEAGQGNAFQKGLFVISSKRALGKQEVGDVLVDGDPPVSAYRSAWFDFGDPQIQKQVSYVTLWMMTTGDPQVTVRHYKDFNLTPITERTYKAQPPDAASLPVLDTVILGSNTYKTERLVPLRFSVAHQSCAWFCFEVETTEDLVLVGYEYEYTTKGTRVVAGVLA